MTRPLSRSSRLCLARISPWLLAPLLLSTPLALALPPAPAAGEEQPGGTTSQPVTSIRAAFSNPSATLSLEQKLDFLVGQSLFEKLWIASPSSTTASDGLGPLFNARACSACHVRNGRGHPPKNPDDPAVSLFLRLGRTPDAEQRRQMEAGLLAAVPDPNYGRQLQTFSVQTVPPEGRLGIAYRDFSLRLADGTEVAMRRPSYRILDPAYGAPAPDLQLSPRLAPPMIGLGLLEAVPQAALDALADPDDRDGDGISGRQNLVWSTREQAVLPGRFGWKAGNATLADQNDSALAGDIGIGNALFPSPWGDCTEAQRPCREAPHGNTDAQQGLEAAATVTDLILFYSRHLAPPVRNDAADPQVLAGKALFHRAGCAACHQPSLHTAEDAPQGLGGQRIWPYSDLLLHDMGPQLADGFGEYGASGSEWRTPPLWGLGLAQRLDPRAGYLHDGRARTLLEAILWHGGEADAARQKVVNLGADERRQLIRFLESL
ncbi:thiol oxidoreductase [Marinobacterium nitratireducens]|uniref:Thiol oxidoreductase n=1 Tax=Marinobacterium nitratireducens TaxID=518897 RepID=A0A917ZEQ8_9GAMM|nr:di-heme oxidoredictase family protein [Marinobacterium nitratireducens]GGO81466.1 thiol oxidoreductase [Marinobacterium nitratireducens]